MQKRFCILLMESECTYSIERDQNAYRINQLSVSCMYRTTAF